MRTRLALLAVVVAAAFPAAARADDPPAPAPDQSTPAPGDPSTSTQDASAPAPDQQPSKPACLASAGTAPDATSLRGVRVGHRAVIKDSNGNTLKVNSVSYCVAGGGLFSFALSKDSDVVLALSTAKGDAIGAVRPRSYTRTAWKAFPKMKKVLTSGLVDVYRVDPRRQLILGIADGRVEFVAAADRLLLEYPGKLGYYLHRLV